MSSGYPETFFLVYKFCKISPSGLSKTEPALFIKTFISDVRPQSVVAIFCQLILVSYLTKKQKLLRIEVHLHRWRQVQKFSNLARWHFWETKFAPSKKTFISSGNQVLRRDEKVPPTLSNTTPQNSEQNNKIHSKETEINSKLAQSKSENTCLTISSKFSYKHRFNRAK